MSKYAQRGLEQRHEQDQLQLIRDTRTLGMKIADFLSNAINTIIGNII